VSIITTAEELADAIRNDPQRVAEYLYRINRFGGQAVGCSVLEHSLSVYDRLAGAPANVRLWALLHDCHEILTGDVVRPYTNGLLVNQQDSIDQRVREALGLRLSDDDAVAVTRADVWRGACEFQEVSAGRRVYHHVWPTIDWVHHVRALLREVAR
jgi:5'-deoxynucleotidase YfbR-like HD superfamily hydrolase